MDCAPLSSPAWTNAATVVIAAAYTVVTAYRWRQGVPIRAFSISGLIAVIAFWLLMIYVPIHSSVQLPLPKPVNPKTCETEAARTGLLIFAEASYFLFVALLTHIILVLVRRFHQRRAA